MIINGQIINDDLALIQQDMLAVLRGNPALGWTPIYTFKDFVVKAVADQNLSIWKDISGLNPGKHGTAIEVRMPALIPKYPNVPGPQQLVELTIRVMEDAAANTTGITCESIGMEIQRWLDGMDFYGLDGAVFTLLPSQTGNSLRPIYDYSDRFAYDVVFTSELPQNARIRVSDTVESDNGAGLVTLTQSDGAAAVYYTMDGSAPIIPLPGKQPAAPTQLYAAPFQVADKTVITWIAWKAGALPSGLGRGVVSFD